MHTSKKIYVDACVQTSGPYRVSLLSSPSTTAPSAKHVTIAIAGHSTPGNDSELSHTGKIYPRTPIGFAKHRLNNAYSPLGARAPPTPSGFERRLVSLPERIEEGMQLDGDICHVAAGNRSVSMPVRLRRITGSITQQEDSAFPSTSFSSSDDYSSSLDNSCKFLDSPHTPTLVSGHTSFEVMDPRLPVIVPGQHFSTMRTQQETVGDLSTVHDDWITWSESLPRPIPALHGPPSLPYARCPSGAEGTLIEEPTSAGGLIWGLKAKTGYFSDSDESNFDPRIGDLAPSSACIVETSTDGVARIGALTLDQERLQSACGNHLSNNTTERQPLHEDRLRPAESVPTAPASVSVDTAHRGVNYPPVGFHNTRQEMGHVQQNSSRKANGMQKLRGPEFRFETVIANRAMHRPVLEAVPLINNHQKTAATISSSAVPFISKQPKGTLVPINVHVQAGLPTPPSTGSPLWSSSPAMFQGMEINDATHVTTHPAALSQNIGLGIAGHSATSLEDLSVQLNRLVIQHQKNFEAITALAQGALGGQLMSTEQVRYTQKPTPAMQPEYRPNMPISLPDLVASHSTSQTPVISSPVASSPIMQSNSVLPPMIFDSHVDTAQNFGVPVVPGSSNSSAAAATKRTLRSVPFNRLLEKKALSPVKEEEEIGFDRNTGSLSRAKKCMDSGSKAKLPDHATTRRAGRVRGSKRENNENVNTLLAANSIGRSKHSVHSN